MKVYYCGNFMGVYDMVTKPKTPHTEILFEGDEPAYSPDGVDLTLIRWMLSLSLKERLDNLQQQVNTILRIGSGQTSN